MSIYNDLNKYKELFLIIQKVPNNFFIEAYIDIKGKGVNYRLREYDTL